jgi:hypothetical protein
MKKLVLLMLVGVFSCCFFLGGCKDKDEAKEESTSDKDAGKEQDDNKKGQKKGPRQFKKAVQVKDEVNKIQDDAEKRRQERLKKIKSK